MPDEFRQIIPAPPPAAEIFARHQLAYEFRREAEYRQEMQQYCQWYYTIAEQNRRELTKLRRDFNLLGWFNRHRH